MFLFCQQRFDAGRRLALHVFRSLCDLALALVVASLLFTSPAHGGVKAASFQQRFDANQISFFCVQLSTDDGLC